ncbi:geranylgeranyl pyrophosphate synthase, chloroplastic [Trifolium repens]|nr:geranylgeranyl pyrophosphate synthase, chloroplastic [Trifolium repens]
MVSITNLASSSPLTVCFQYEHRKASSELVKKLKQKPIMSSVNFGTWVSPNSMLNQTITYQSTNTVLTNAYKVKAKKTGEALDKQLYQRNQRRLTKLYDTPSWPEENESIRSSLHC